MNQEACDLVHFPHFNVPIRYRRPYIVTIHDLILSLYPGQKMKSWYHKLGYKMVIKNAAKKSAHIIAVSENTKKDIIEHFNVPPQKVSVIYNGVSPEFKPFSDYDKVEKTLKKYDIKKNFLLYTGVWRGHKNLERLIQALYILREEKELDVQLVMTGKPDPHYPEVLAAIDRFKLQDQVITPGLVESDELVHLYNAASIYVFPSLYEGFGLPPLEAMSCATPVVASNRSCIPEVCGAGNALFFDPENPGDLANKVDRLYRDADLQAEFIDKGLTQAQRYNWQDSHEKTVALYDKVYKNHYEL